MAAPADVRSVWELRDAARRVRHDTGKRDLADLFECLADLAEHTGAVLDVDVHRALSDIDALIADAREPWW